MIGYSVSNTAFNGTSGALVSFTLKSSSVPGNFSLIIQNPLLGDSQSVNILTSFQNGTVTVLAPNISLSSTGLNYGSVALTANLTRILQITNNGNRDLIISGLIPNRAQFALTDATPFTITPGSSRSISVKFAPTIKGDYAKQLQINSNDPDQVNINLSLNAIAFAVNEHRTGNVTGASSSKRTLDFSLNNMELFTGFQFDLTLPQPMKYTSGTATLFRSTDHIVSVNSVNANTIRVMVFSASNQNFTGNSGKILSLDFDLMGVAGGYSIGINNVIIANNSGENIVSASYGGSLQITSPDISSSTQLNFGDVSILSSSTKVHRIYNYGQEALTITQLMFNSDHFRCNQVLPVTIQPSQFLDLPVEFSKSIKDTVTGTIQIVSNDPDENPFIIQLSGNAFAPNYMLIKPLTINQSEKNIQVEIENEEPFVAFQFDLSFPAGLIPDLNAIALTSRKQDHIISVTYLSSNSIRIISYSLSQKSYTGKFGSIIAIPFFAEPNLLTGIYNLSLTNYILSDINSTNNLYSALNGILTITFSTGAEFSNSNQQIHVYALRNIHIQIDGKVGSHTIASLYDLQGHIILKKKLSMDSRNIIELPAITDGIYILQINDNKIVQNFKLSNR